MAPWRAAQRTYGGESQAWTQPNPTSIDFTGAWIRYFKMGCAYNSTKKKRTPTAPCADQYAYVTMTYGNYNLDNVVYHAAKHRAYEGSDKDKWFTSPDGDHPDVGTGSITNYSNEAYRGLYSGVCYTGAPDDD